MEEYWIHRVRKKLKKTLTNLNSQGILKGWFTSLSCKLQEETKILNSEISFI